MLSYEDNELIVIKTCPRCAKDGRGRGILSTERRKHNVNGSWIECRLCGWWGDEVQCQEYCFPMDVEQVVVMDLEVLQNLWAFALRKDEPAEISVPGSQYWPAPTFEIKAEDCMDRLMKMDSCLMETALRLLVARGCLLPGFYKIKHGEKDNG